MLILYDFKCDKCGEVEELLLHMRHRNDHPNHKCGGSMTRVISPVRSNLEGLSGHFPDAADKWAKRHEKAGRQPSETHPKGWK